MIAWRYELITTFATQLRKVIRSHLVTNSSVEKTEKQLEICRTLIDSLKATITKLQKEHEVKDAEISRMPLSVFQIR